ncbi:MAG: SDR family oxidoreductase [Kofleriaceae bacterium]
MSGRVWIVGASSGIGEAMALAYASRGASLVLSARRQERLAQVAAAARPRAGTDAAMHVVPLDVTAAAAIPEATARAWDALGGLDTIVLCAGVSQRSLAHETVLEVDRRLMEVNYFGPIAIVKALLPRLMERGGGQLIVLSSVAGRVGTPLRSAYAASKHALHGFFDSLRAELYAHGISVSIACPGYVSTSITMSSLVGDGSAYGRIDDDVRDGMPVARCAETILARAERGVEEFVVATGKARLAIPVKRYAPRLFSRLVRGHQIS